MSAKRIFGFLTLMLWGLKSQLGEMLSRSGIGRRSTLSARKIHRRRQLQDTWRSCTLLSTMQ